MANEFQIKHGLIVSGSAEIEQDLRVRGTLTVDELHTSTTTSSVLYESGSTRFGDSSDDIHEFTGSIKITGSISLNGDPLGTGKLDETTFQTYTSSNDGRVSNLETSSGSLNSFTSSINTTIKSKLDNDSVISGSVQVNITGTTGYSTFSSSISSSIDTLSSSISSSINTLSSSIDTLSSSISTTDLNQSNRLTSIENKTGSYATTGSNLFIGTQTHSGSILPSVDNAYDLGSVEYQWRDVYISSGSLYIDGTKVLSSTAQELIITTDEGQSIKILEGTTDSIVLQTADGNIELKSNADGDILLDPTNGKIMLKGTVEVLNGNKIQSSVNGTPVVFANDIVVSGSIDLTGTIDGIDLQSLSSSFNNRLGGLETSTGSLNSFTSSASSRLNSIETVTSSFVTYSGTTNSRLTSIETSTSSLNSFTSSANSRLNSIETSTGSLNNYTGSNNTIIGTLQTATGALNSYTSSNTTNINAIHTATSSLNEFTNSINTTIKSKLNTDGVISGSSQVNITGTTGYSTFSSSLSASIGVIYDNFTTLSASFTETDEDQEDRISVIESRYVTTGSNVFKGDQTVTGSLYISQNLIVQGSSSLENITASAVSIGTNKIILNSDTPAIRYAGISVFDSGSTNVTASLFYDSLTNNWKFQHSDVGTDDASILIYGPLGTGIDNAPTLVGNFLTKVEDNGHGHHLTTSSIFDNGSKISLKNNTEITGSLIITSTIVSQGTTLVSGSGQISYAGITNVPSGIVSGAAQVKSLLPTGTVSGSSQVLNGSGVWSGSAQLPSGIVSGSSQVSFNGITDKPTLVSGSSQVSFNGITDKPTLVSGSSQITFSGLSGIPSGIVSGSSQVLAGTTIHSGSFFNNITVVSGSAQISFNGITDKPTLVSGSSQISYPSLSNIPGGIVSGSSQIDLTATTNYSSGIKTRLNAEGVVSGSSQITLTSTQVTNGLGFTPYNSTNPNGYISSVPTQSQLISPNGATVVAADSAMPNAGHSFIHSLALGPGGNDGHILGMSWASTTSIYGTQIFLDTDPTDTMAIRSRSNSGVWTSWKTVFHSGNFTDNSSNWNTAFGWGNHASAGYITSSSTITGAAARLSTRDNRTISPSEDSAGQLRFGFTSWANNDSSPYADYLHLRSYSDGSGGSDNLVMFLKSGIGMRIYQQTYGSSTAYSSFKDVAWTDGTNASGSWGINVTGTAASETLATVTGRGAITTTLVTLSKTNSTLYNANAYNGGTGQLSITSTVNQTGVYNGIRFAGGSGSHEGFFGTVQNSSGLAEFIFQTFNGSSYGERTRITSRGSLLHGHAAVPSEDAWLGTAVFGRDSYNKVIIGSLQSSTTGAYIGGHNSALTAWGDLNIAGEALIFRYQQTERARFDTSGHFIPGANNAYNLGSSSLRWANIFTNDLHLSNMNKPGGNDVDGTKGDWTIQEGAENLYIINNNNGKKYKITLEETL
jgi:hypothetical protein